MLDSDLKILFVNWVVRSKIANVNMLNRYLYDIFRTDIDLLAKQIEFSQFYRTGIDHFVSLTDADKYGLPYGWSMFCISKYKKKIFLLIGNETSEPQNFLDSNPLGVFWELLLRLEQKYQNILDILPDAVFIHLPDGRIIDVNERTLQMYRGSRSALLNSSVEDISGKGYSNELAQKQINEALKNGSHSFFWMARTLDGFEFPVEVRLKKMQIEDEIYVIAVVTDLTEIQLLEKQIHRLETKYFNIFRFSPVGIMYVSPSLIVTEANEKLARLLDVDLSQILQKEIHTLPFSKKFYDRLNEALQQGKTTSLDFSIRKRSHYSSLRAYFTPEFAERGNPSCVIIIEDLTKEKNELRHRVETEKRYRSLINNALIGIVIFNKAGEILFINKRLEEMSGYYSDELIGKKVWDFVHPEDIPKAMSQFSHRWFEGKFPPEGPMITPYEIRLLDKKQEEHWVLITGGKIRYKHEPAIMINILDITEKKMLESQLIHSQKMESMGRMVAGITHDFNNYLGILKGYFGLFKMMLKDRPEMAENFEAIGRTLDNAEKMIQDLLKFAKKQKTEKELISLNQLIQSSTSLIRQTIGKRIAIEFQLDAENDLVEAAPSQLDQVLMNLVINAADALEGNPNPKISVRTENIQLEHSLNTYFDQIPAGEYVVLIVKDNGCGIPSDILEKIFDPFFTTKEQGKGTGMGLAISAGIIKEHGGYIGLNSMVGKGTTFYIYLPVPKNIPGN